MTPASPSLKPVFWIASSLDDLREFPEDVRDEMGFAIFQAQSGGKHVSSKPLNGFGGGGVIEVVDDYDGSAYRTVYTVKLARAIYVLHAFQKKSTKGIKTPDREIEKIRARLKMAIHDYKERYEQGK